MNYVSQLKSIFDSPDRNDDFKNYLFETIDSRIDNDLFPKVNPIQCFSKNDMVSECIFFFSLNIISNLWLFIQKHVFALD